MSEIFEPISSVFYSAINSTATTNIIQLFAALVVWGIYSLKQRSRLRDVAKMILIEIRSLQPTIERIREKGVSPETLPLIVTDNWSSNKYIVVNKFDTDEFKRLNDFFEGCEMIENIRKRNEYQFDEGIKEKARLWQQYIARSLWNNHISGHDREKRKGEFLDKFGQEKSNFTAHYTERMVNEIMQNVPQDIAITTVGEKLKRLAGIK